MIDKLIDEDPRYSIDPSISLARTLKDLLRWIYNNSGKDIATHYSSFLEGVTGKDERLNEDTDISKVPIGVE